LSGPPELVKTSFESVSKWRYSPSDVDRVTIVNIVFARPRSSPFVYPRLTHKEPIPSYVRPSDVGPLEPINAVRPVYPPLAKTANVQGKVTLRITVDKDGSVSDIKVLSGYPLLVKAALDAVPHWRYAPRSNPALTDVALDFAPPKGDSADSSVTPPMLIYQPKPPYPQDAKAGELEGNVVLQVMIGADGAVSSVEVVKSLDKSLDDSAVRTVKTWKFLPAMKAGRPVPRKSRISVSFKYS
jgi:TonB family protein